MSILEKEDCVKRYNTAQEKLEDTMRMFFEVSDGLDIAGKDYTLAYVEKTMELNEEIKKSSQELLEVRHQLAEYLSDIAEWESYKKRKEESHGENS